MDAITQVPAPLNEPVLNYAPGSPERAALETRLAELAADPLELTATIGGRQRMAAGEKFEVVQPHRHAAVLGTSAHATHGDAEDAVRCAKEAAPGWAELSFDDRAAVFLKAADLLAGPWRQTLNAATMLGQSKTAYQAEIDAACELIDFWRFNVHFARQILAEQPKSAPGVWNRVDHRPLEGFVYAITPFNFTAIAGNLPTAPALMGNTVVWKPSPTQQFAAHFLMRLLEEAGLPPGVINLVTGDGIPVSEVALADRDLAGIHFTGSTAGLPAPVADGRGEHRELPRLPADRRRDRRQGLRRRARLGRRRRAAHRDDPRRLRVPGPEVLGGLARLRAAQRLGPAPRRPRRARPRRCRWATSPTSRTSWAPSSTGSRSPGSPACSTGRRTTPR